ncbi:hypothetical protein CJU89_0254 [Yarrowia sp. B02]|nr:hypothetical protein CJU89_0254 [Yarrowia sp. B02]
MPAVKVPIRQVQLDIPSLVERKRVREAHLESPGPEDEQLFDKKVKVEVEEEAGESVSDESDSSDTTTIDISNHTVILLDKKGPYTHSITSHTRYTPASDEVLVRNKVIGLNPIDWKAVRYGFGVYSFPWINGRESAGIVESVGESVTRVSPGDEVIVTSTSYRDNRTSTFQQYTIAKGDNLIKKPSSISFNAAATLGVGAVTSTLAFADNLNILPLDELPTPKPSPKESESWVVVWGGACVTGIYAIQLAKHLDFNVLAVSSKESSEYVKSFGADVVLDRHDIAGKEQDSIIAAIPEDHTISHGFDCVGSTSSSHLAGVLSRQNQTSEKVPLVCLVKSPSKPDELARFDEDKVRIESVLIKKFHEDLDHGLKVSRYLEQLLELEILRPAKHQEIAGGLQLGVIEGLRKLEHDNIRAQKLVVPV